MKCLYLYFITVTVMSASVPQDLCETCVPTQDCPLFENLNITDQLKWMEKFPCGSLQKNDDFKVPAGFAAAAKGDYVCCSNNKWGGETSLNFGPNNNHNYYHNNYENLSNGPENNTFSSYDHNNPMNSPKNEDFNNYYYNKYKRPLNNNNDNIDSSNNDVDDYNSNTNNNYDSNQSTPNDASTVWFPDRSRNYDNTDYWQTDNPEKNGASNNKTYWNDISGREQNLANTQKPHENEARTPNQYDPPRNVATPPYHYYPPGNDARPPGQNYPPNNMARPPNQYDPPGNDARPPGQNYPPGNMVKPPNQYYPPGNDDRAPDQNYPPGNIARPPNQYVPPGEAAKPPGQNYPPGNTVKPPHQFDPPGNEARLPGQNYPPGNIARPPNQYDPPGNEANHPVQSNPPGNIVRPPIQYDPPGNMARPPVMPPWNDMARPPQYNGPEDNIRLPNDYYSPGNSGPPNNYFPPGNMGRPNTYFPPANNNFMAGPNTNSQWHPPDNYYQRNRRNHNNYDSNNSNLYNTGSPYNLFNQDNNLGNFGGGQCSLTSFPPDAQSDCCGRQLADYDRITGWNNKTAFTTPRASTPPSRSSPKWRGRRTISENDIVTVENRISGGHATELYEYPWTVLLLTTFDYGQREAAFNCGGGLISAKYVLTAGHCVYDKDASVKSVQVYLAEYDKNSFPKDCKSTGYGRRCIDNVMMYADEVITHPQYENENLVNDIALLRLRGSASYTEYIRSICLPTINIDEPKFSDYQFEVAGWGRVGSYSSNIKQSTVLHLVNHKQCKQYYPQLTNKHLCAAGKKGEDTCKGDSGGPLMILYRGKYHVAGIVSGKRADSPCGTSVPSLYTNVYHYVDWIRSIIRN